MRTINPARLLQDSFAAVRPVYWPVLLLSLPSLAMGTVSELPLPSNVLLLINLLAFFGVTPWVSGATIVYLHQATMRDARGVPIVPEEENEPEGDRSLAQPSSSLTDADSDEPAGTRLGKAAYRALQRLPQLTMGVVLLTLPLIPGFITFVFARTYASLELVLLPKLLIGISGLLLIPGLYVCVRLFPLLYLLALENCWVVDALSRSWALLRRRWWPVFSALLLINLVIFIPIQLIRFFLGLLIAQTPIAVPASVPASVSYVLEGSLAQALPWIQEVIEDVGGFLFTPVIGVYCLLLYLRLSAIAQGSAPPADAQNDSP